MQLDPTTKRRRTTYRRATQCRYCEQHTATFFARSGPGRAWYLCGNPACRRMHEGPAQDPAVPAAGRGEEGAGLVLEHPPDDDAVRVHSVADQPARSAGERDE